MAGSTPYQAIEAYLQPLQRVVSCLTQGKVIAERPRSSEPPDIIQARTFPLTLAEGQAVTLRASPGSERFAFSMSQRFALVHVPDDDDRGPWKAQTRDYEYAVYRVTQDGPKELFAYHYHPSSQLSRVKRPHLHLRSAAGVAGVLEAAHYLTGRVALEEVVWMLLDDRDNRFGVRPFKSNWREELQESLDTFERWRTWPGASGSAHPLT